MARPPSQAMRTVFLIDLDKGPLQLPIAAKGINLAFGLAQVGSRGEAFGDCFAIHLMCQPQMLTVVRIIGTVAMATWIPTAATSGGNRPSAKNFQIRNLPQDGGPLLFEIGE
jgi:hypothetical protein